MGAYEKLMRVQSKLKAPKGQTNKFGGYKYRSCEDIMEALKPLLAEEKLVLVMRDTPIIVDGRHYIQASAELIDAETDISLIVTQAVARESEEKKGMDASQISGASSSYARKYCLNAMFLIDDTKDADTWKPADKNAVDFATLKDSINKCTDAQALSSVAKEITKSYNDGNLTGVEQQELKELYNSKVKALK